MFFTFFLLLWTYCIFPVKSQFDLKPINFYDPIPIRNGFSSLKSFSEPLIIYQDMPNQLPWLKYPRTQHQKKTPQGQFVLYYPPPKPNHKFKNIKVINHGINSNNHNINNYQHKDTNYNKVPKKFNHNPNLSWEKLKTQEKMKIDNNRDNYQIKNEKQGGNLNSEGRNLYPPVPNTFMEPPGLATSDYRYYEPKENFEEGKKKKEYDNYYSNHKLNEEEDFDDRAPYIRDHAPENDSEDLEESSEVEAEDSKEEKDTKQISNISDISLDGDRVDFQFQGHNGPKTYVFGFDTGDGKNRQYRLEERLKDGTVKGQYGYYDARGKLRAIKYIARPLEGYEEKHHESLTPNSS